MWFSLTFPWLFQSVQNSLTFPWLENAFPFFQVFQFFQSEWEPCVKISQGFRSGNFVELYVSKIQVSTLISTCCWPVLTKSPCPVSTIQEVGRHEQFQSYFRGDGKFRDLGRAVCVTHLVCEVHAYFLKYVWSKKKKERNNHNLLSSRTRKTR